MLPKEGRLLGCHSGGEGSPLGPRAPSPDQLGRGSGWWPAGSLWSLCQGPCLRKRVQVSCLWLLPGLPWLGSAPRLASSSSPS